MERYRQWILSVLAITLILVAGAMVLWLVHPPATGPLAFVRKLLDCPSASERQSADSITYRFLFPNEVEARRGTLTLGRFSDRRLCEGATWRFDSIDQWHGLAPSICEQDRQWVAEHQSGWQISRWLVENGNSAYGRDHLFWSIQALRCLDPESFVNEIDMIERSGRTVCIRVTEGPSHYDFDTDTLDWNPTSIPDPFVALTRELHHVWYDLCREGDLAEVRQREHSATMAENRMRHILFLKDPTHSQMGPRPRRGETSPEVVGDSAREAWQSYRESLPP